MAGKSLRWVVCWAVIGVTTAARAQAPEPVVEESERHLAINEPDRFAWLLFERVNQAVPNDPQGRVAWETWALARDVFADPNAKPVWKAVSNELRNGATLEHLPLQQRVLLQEEQQRTGIAPRFDESAAQGQFNETRMNWFAFDYIVRNDLYNVEGQEAFFARGENFDFPLDAIEVKAQWRKILPADAARYHTARTTNPDQLWGLTSLHVTTKDLPNWFWATFEHESNPEREAVVPSRDSHGLPAVLKGTKWENYVLRGTQTNFVDAIGRPTILASSQVERGFQRTSSCITCHARSTIGERPRDGTDINRLDVFEADGGSVGVPNPKWYVDTDRLPPAREYVQMDFVWSLSRADRKTTGRSSVDPAPPVRTAAGVGRSAADARQVIRAALDAAGAQSEPDSIEFVKSVNRRLKAAARLGRAGRSIAPTQVLAAPAAERPQTTLDRARAQAKADTSIFTDPTWRKNQAKLWQLLSSAARPGTQIFGGRPATLGEFRDCVAVGSADSFCCTGTLIGPNVVLTAGHCEFGDCASRIYVGLDANQPDPARIYAVQTAIRHPDYDPGTLQNDVALLILAEDVPDVVPRRLASTADVDSAFFVRLAGYGFTEFGDFGVQMTVDVATATTDCNCADCQSRYGCHPGFEFVAGGNGVDSCNGDSGGPAYVVVGNEMFLAGSTSRATSNSVVSCGDGGIYVRSDQYADWIEETASQNGGRLATVADSDTEPTPSDSP